MHDSPMGARRYAPTAADLLLAEETRETFVTAVKGALVARMAA
ncbi:hypothetical protein [Streptomyces sp. WAC 01529]|nr:hypothetical protein [Streptomyces sp. WAC 01529]